MMNRIVMVVVVVLGASIAGPVAAESTLPEELRQLMDGTVTARGVPVIKMWRASMPQPDVMGAGYRPVPGITHRKLYDATWETGAYNHHTRIAVHDGRFYGSWSNGFFAEDASGQRVLFSTSEDGAHWSDWRVLFPSPDEIRGNGEPGYYLYAGGWESFDGKLYAAATFYRMLGFENADRTSFSPTADAEHLYHHMERHGVLMREVTPGGELGPIFMLEGKLPADGELLFDVLPAGAILSEDATKRLRTAYRGGDMSVVPPHGMNIGSDDDVRLSEGNAWQREDGTWVCLLRDDKFSHRKYVSVSQDDGATWTPAMPTNIPDSPSAIVSVTLDNGTVLVLGNLMAPESGFDNPKPKHYDRDPLMIAVSKDGYTFTEAYALRAGQHDYVVPRTVVRGRGGGAQYPDFVVHDHALYVIYSMGKEAVWVSRVPLEPFEQ